MNEESSCRCVGSNEQGKEKVTLEKGVGKAQKTTGGGAPKAMAKSSRPEYGVWWDMKTRCFNPKCKAYKHYGGRGITVCKRWMNFENFLADMGERPEGMSIDRFPNNDGNYEPGNCRWATQQQQSENTRIVLNIGGVSQSQLARNLGSSQGCIYHRRKHGLPANAPVHQLRKGKWHHNASLTEEQVSACREVYDASTKGYGIVAAMAKCLGVSKAAVYLAVRRVTWKHLP